MPRAERQPRPVPATLVTPHASEAAQALMRSLVDEYGQVTRSGVISPADAQTILRLAGVTPAILGGDLMDYTPSRIARGADPAGLTESLIAAARRGHTITLCWHWNAPTDLIDIEHHVDAHGKPVNAAWYRGFYSHATRFDFAAALDRPSSVEFAMLLRDIDAIAVELWKLQQANVPVLWRPLHEADGGWFWWGTRGSTCFKRLWNLLYERLVHHHRLDHLLWVFTVANPEWYPGDATVDLVGVDAYPPDVTDTLLHTWRPIRERFDGRKLIALTEFGGVPDLDRMRQQGVLWSYFVSWTGDEGPTKTPQADLRRIYRSPLTKNLDAQPLSN